MTPTPMEMAQAIREIGADFGNASPANAVCHQAADMIEALVKANTWQPIETAPKDGTAIIAWWPHLAKPVVAWISWRGTRGGNWVASHSTSYMASMSVAPTHWMPLPEPPALGHKGVERTPSSGEG